MRTMLLTAASALALGAAVPAFADSGDMPATTRFTIIADAQAHQQPAQQRYAAGQATRQVNAAQTHDLGTWLFPPTQGNGQ